LLSLCILRVFFYCFRGITSGSSLHSLPKLSLHLCTIWFAKVPVELCLLGSIEIIHKLVSEVSVLPTFFSLIAAVVLIGLCLLRILIWSWALIRIAIIFIILVAIGLGVGARMCESSFLIVLSPDGFIRKYLVGLVHFLE
jgi:hypothetical protein